MTMFMVPLTGEFYSGITAPLLNICPDNRGRLWWSLETSQALKTTGKRPVLSKRSTTSEKAEWEQRTTGGRLAFLRTQEKHGQQHTELCLRKVAKRFSIEYRTYVMSTHQIRVGTNIFTRVKIWVRMDVGATFTPKIKNPSKVWKRNKLEWRSPNTNRAISLRVPPRQAYEQVKSR